MNSTLYPEFFTEMAFSDVEVVHVLFKYCVNGEFALHTVNLTCFKIEEY